MGSPAGAREALPALAQDAQVGQLHPGCLPMPHEAGARQLLCSRSPVRIQLAVAQLGESRITHKHSETVSGAVNSQCSDQARWCDCSPSTAAAEDFASRPCAATLLHDEVPPISFSEPGLLAASLLAGLSDVPTYK